MLDMSDCPCVLQIMPSSVFYPAAYFVPDMIAGPADAGLPKMLAARIC